MGPIMVVFMGMGLVDLPEAARVLRRSPRHLQLFCFLVGSGLSVAAVAWGAVLLVASRGGSGTGCSVRYGGQPTRWCCPS